MVVSGRQASEGYQEYLKNVQAGLVPAAPFKPDKMPGLEFLEEECEKPGGAQKSARNSATSIINYSLLVFRIHTEFSLLCHVLRSGRNWPLLVHVLHFHLQVIFFFKFASSSVLKSRMNSGINTIAPSISPTDSGSAWGYTPRSKGGPPPAHGAGAGGPPGTEVPRGGFVGGGIGIKGGSGKGIAFVDASKHTLSDTFEVLIDIKIAASTSCSCTSRGLLVLLIGRGHYSV